jgi:phage-related protein
LDARAADNANFDFTPPGEGSASKFVCEQWSKSIPYLNRATIQATFRQVFEP